MKAISSTCSFVLLILLVVPGAPAADRSQVYEILKQKCHACHGEAGSDEGGMNYILSSQRLIATKQVVPGKPLESELLRRVIDREMPPEGEGKPLSKSEVQVLEEWIAAGAPQFADKPDRPFITNDKIIEAILLDVNAAPAGDRRYHRYFTITHLYNGLVSDDELATYRLALSKMLNSLSWDADLIHPQPVDEAETILRVDVRDMRWTTRYWELIVALYPYAVRQESDQANDCYEQTGTVIPYVRADWFVAIASRPPLYHSLAGIPDSLAELESLLRMNFDLDVQQERIARAGFSSSGVSAFPRIIERHKIAHGALWRSYDFAGSTGNRKFFANPLFFEADGGEIIFNLPNGLQGYMLIDAAGRRINTAPITIVRDPETADGAVINGISCIRCHAAGIIPKKDEVRANVLASERSFERYLHTVKAIYVDHDEFARLVDEDRERFASALKKLGIPSVSRQSEPIHNISHRFAEALDINLAAAEIGVPTARLQEYFDTFLTVMGTLRVEGGTVTRERFDEMFPIFVKAFDVGDYQEPSKIDADRVARLLELQPTNGGEVEVDPNRSRWFNKSYNNILVHIKGRQWAQMNHKTGEITWYLEEIDRTDEYIDLYLPVRDQIQRIFAKRMDLKKGDDWVWLSDGHWLDPAEQAKSSARSRWLNTSYDTTIYHVKDDRWAERDNKTGKIKWHLEETARNDVYIEMYNPVRKKKMRFFSDRADHLVNDNWKWLSNGRWIDSQLQDGATDQAPFEK